MTSLFGIMNIGQQGIFNAQRALQVTGQNIANSNTEGYSRQEAVFRSLTDLRGAKISEIRRMRDEFLDFRQQDALQDFGRAEIKSQFMNRLEAILDETNQDGIGTAFQEFFQSLQQLSLNPGGFTEREVVRSQAENLTHVVQSTYEQLQTEREEANSQIRSTITDVNEILRSIGEINSKLSLNSTSNSINELFDQRQQLIFELQEKLPANVIEIGDNTVNSEVTIYSSSGLPLINGIHVSQFIAEENPANEGFVNVVIQDATGLKQNATEFIKTSEMGGLLQVRDEIIPEQMRWLDDIVSSFTTEFNLQHQSGMGLNGSTGQNFFEPVSVYASKINGNSGNAETTGDFVVDQSLLTHDEYEIVFTGPGTYDVLNTTQGTTVTSGAPYTSGNPITFDGMQVTVTNAFGSPVAGDRFKINSVNRTAENFSVSSAIKSTIENFAAGNSASPGDNQNLLQLQSFEDSALLNGQTINSFIDTKIANLGINVRQAHNDLETQTFATNQINNFIEETSGVSLDEESTNLIRFQRSFQASAKVISVIDESMQSIINIL